MCKKSWLKSESNSKKSLTAIVRLNPVGCQCGSGGRSSSCVSVPQPSVSWWWCGSHGGPSATLLLLLDVYKTLLVKRNKNKINKKTYLRCRRHRLNISWAFLVVWRVPMPSILVRRAGIDIDVLAMEVRVVAGCDVAAIPIVVVPNVNWIKD